MCIYRPNVCRFTQVPPSKFLAQLDMLTTFIKLQMSLVQHTKDCSAHLEEKKTDQSIFSSLSAVK